MYKTILNPKYRNLAQFVDCIPAVFEKTGEVIYTGRNLIKVFDVDGLKVNVKRYISFMPIYIIAYCCNLSSYILDLGVGRLVKASSIVSLEVYYMMCFLSVRKLILKYE